MSRALLALAFATRLALAQDCLCTNGCYLTSGPFPPKTIARCDLYHDAVYVGSWPAYPSTYIGQPDGTCQPTDPPYSPGPAGSQVCAPFTGKLAVGPQHWRLVAVDMAGVETSVGYDWVNDTALPNPVLPPPAHLRIKP